MRTAWSIAVVLAAAVTATAQSPEAAPTFVGGYMWKQVGVQGSIHADETYRSERMDFWGGRVNAGFSFGRVGIEARVDAAGLKDVFDPNNPQTFQTIEAYGMVHYVAFAAGGMQIGPAVYTGIVTSLEEGSPWTGFRVNSGGVGVRFAGSGSEVELMAARTDYLPRDPRWRLVTAVHLRLNDKLYVVGDGISGLDGFVRVGIAVKVF